MALAHVLSVLVALVLSYQRRVSGIKKHFLGRGRTTPLGLVHDIWDRTRWQLRGRMLSALYALSRTEAQQRGALHAHILVASTKALNCALSMRLFTWIRSRGLVEAALAAQGLGAFTFGGAYGAWPRT